MDPQPGEGGTGVSQPAVAAPADWAAAIADMAREADGLRAAGSWRSGERTLLHALGLQNRELMLTAGLRWLLTPEAHHGLGDRVLRRLCARLGVADVATHPVALIAEESRDEGRTRADLIVRAPGLCLLIESKVGAVEQPDQCDRLAGLWADEEPVLVFLTRDGREPHTARGSKALWKPLSWADIAEIVEAAGAEAAEPAPGVAEYLQTLTIFQGRGAPMTIDAKTEFFLAHRERIVEWSAIYAAATEQLHETLVGVAGRLPTIAAEGSVAVRQLPRGWWAVLARRTEWGADGSDVAIGVGWKRDELLGPPGPRAWPYLGIAVSANQAGSAALAAAVKEATRSAAGSIGWTDTSPGWPWWGHLSEPGPFDIDAFGEQCAARLVVAWQTLSPIIGETLRRR